MNKDQLQKIVIDALEDLKAKEIVVQDVSKLTNMTDVMIFVSGSSTRHVKSLADKVTTEVKKHGVMPLGVEGEDAGEWVLVDLADIIVHIMLPEIRDLYALEKLWSVEIAGDNKEKDKVKKVKDGRRLKGD